MTIEIITGPTEHGWCDFSVQTGNDLWSCQASYIGKHPLKPLIHSAVDLHGQLFVDPIPEEDAVCDPHIRDEPGGISIRASPVTQAVEVSVYYDSGEIDMAEHKHNC